MMRFAELGRRQRPEDPYASYRPKDIYGSTGFYVWEQEEAGADRFVRLRFFCLTRFFDRVPVGHRSEHNQYLSAGSDPGGISAWGGGGDYCGSCGLRTSDWDPKPGIALCLCKRRVGKDLSV